MHLEKNVHAINCGASAVDKLVICSLQQDVFQPTKNTER